MGQLLIMINDILFWFEVCAWIIIYLVSSWQIWLQISCAKIRCFLRLVWCSSEWPVCVIVSILGHCSVSRNMWVLDNRPWCVSAPNDSRSLLAVIITMSLLQVVPGVTLLLILPLLCNGENIKFGTRWWWLQRQEEVYWAPTDWWRMLTDC